MSRPPSWTDTRASVALVGLGWTVGSLVAVCAALSLLQALCPGASLLFRRDPADAAALAFGWLVFLAPARLLQDVVRLGAGLRPSVTSWTVTSALLALVVVIAFPLVETVWELAGAVAAAAWSGWRTALAERRRPTASRARQDRRPRCPGVKPAITTPTEPT